MSFGTVLEVYSIFDMLLMLISEVSKHFELLMAVVSVSLTSAISSSNFSKESELLSNSEDCYNLIFNFINLAFFLNILGPVESAV